MAEEKLGREIDAIIAPTAPTAAVRHDKFKYAGYTSVISLLDFTSVVVPVMFADKDVDRKTEGYRPKNAIDWGVWEECEISILYVRGSRTFANAHMKMMPRYITVLL